MSHPMEGSRASETDHLLRDLEKKKGSLQLEVIAIDRIIKELKRLAKQDKKERAETARLS